ncbi:adenylate/guanylate cyclase domain-containing protein [Mucilaginibacter litoreus]|uniref:Adenylate/guanylate cyclase domain-containing protein n=1 Tax=Mucilaginibacter litoreus TaxID=1048221 RepID=A0ABW3AUU3_9SPHI
MKNEYLSLNTACQAYIQTEPDVEHELAILFLDIRNFTGLMEAQPGQTVIHIVRRLFTAFNQIVKNFKGRVIEIAGDNLYAVFGLQTSLSEAANNAYQAAKTMFQTVTLFNEAYAESYNGGPLEIGVGMHAGKVFVGEFGLNGNKQLSVMGLPVNIAARLQAKTKELDNDMLISEEAYSLLDTVGDSWGSQTVTLQGISHGQQVRLAGKPYVNSLYLNTGAPELDYLLAISG